MGDEFVKGLGLLTGAGLVWMVLAGWYRTPGFEKAQLTGPIPENLNAFDQLAVITMEAMFWLAIFGALTFWVLIPAGRQLQEKLSGE